MSKKENKITNFDESIERFYYSNEDQKESKKNAEKYKKQLKGAFKIGDVYQTRDGKFELKISAQNRSSTNQEKLLEILKEHGHTDAIKTVERVDEERVEELLHSGALTANDINPAVSTSTSAVLKVKALAGGENVEQAPTKKATQKPTF